MSEQHWQIIEGCVESELAKLESVQGWWEEGSPPDLENLREIEAHKAALAFISETKTYIAELEGQLAEMTRLYKVNRELMIRRDKRALELEDELEEARKPLRVIEQQPFEIDLGEDE